jgi:intracellular septation protein
VIERMLDSNIQLPALVWKRLNMSWVIFFVLMGLINIYVAFYYGLELSHEARNDIWVNFKLFGMMGLTLAFVIGQAFYLARHMQDDKNEVAAESPGENS